MKSIPTTPSQNLGIAAFFVVTIPLILYSFTIHWAFACAALARTNNHLTYYSSLGLAVAVPLATLLLVAYLFHYWIKDLKQEA